MASKWASKYHPLMMKQATCSLKARPSHPRGKFPPPPNLPRTGEATVWLAAREAWPGAQWRCFTLDN